MTADVSQIHPSDTRDLRSRIDGILRSFLDEQELALREMMDDAGTEAHWPTVIAGLREFLAGGKRLRPLFCVWGWRGAGGDSDQVLTAAAALELLHGFALIHDDIIDGSDLRRGAPSVHRAHEFFHARAGKRGSSEDFGVAVAILVGDLCLNWFRELLDRSRAAPERLDRARLLMSRAFTELIAGQYLDLTEQTALRSSLARAVRVMRYKTAKYTIERPLQLGGILAGADESLLAQYSAYALPLGEAFQLRDDILGAFGDSAVTGKSASDDLSSGKATALLAMTRDMASSSDSREIDRMLRELPVGRDGVERLRTLMVDTGAVAEVEHRINDCADAAVRALEGMAVDHVVRRSLRDLIDAAAYRSH